jgi:hypothetical protein
MAAAPQQPALEKYILRVPAQLVRGQTPLAQKQAELVQLEHLAQAQSAPPVQQT